MRSIANSGLFFLGLFFFLTGLHVNSSSARSATIIGVWHGGGKINPNNKATEKARCRAHIQQRSANSFTGSFNCSSSSGLARQSVDLRKVGRSRYAGSFYNAQNNVRGSISMSVHGNTLSASMRSTKGTGWIRMRRR